MSQKRSEKHNENNKLKPILFEPIGPYYADVLNTLSSVVQALALGVFAIEIEKLPSFFHDFRTVQFGIMFLVVCALWQRYITHNQLYVWHLDALDTIIPMGFGLLEVLLILAIPEKPMSYFSFLFALLATWGFIAYTIYTFKFNNLLTQKIYEEHFSEHCESGFAQALFEEVKQFGIESRRKLCLVAIVMWECYWMIRFESYSDTIKKIIFSFLSITVLFYLLYYDIWQYLMREGSKLNNHSFLAKFQENRWKRKFLKWLE